MEKKEIALSEDSKKLMSYHKLVGDISVVTDWPYNKIVNAVGDIIENSINDGDNERVTLIASLNYIFRYAQ